MGELRRQDLQDIVPVQMDVGIDALSAVVATGIDNEAIVGVYVSRLVDGVVARTQTPGRIPSVVPAVAGGVVVVLWPWRQAKVHEMGDGRLPFAIVEWTHSELPNQLLLAQIHPVVLTDSTIASSSVCRKRFDPLCCFLLCWLLRGVGEARLEAPVPALPRCWPKKLTVLSAGWVCAGEDGPDEADTLDDDATGGGLEDIVQPNQGSTMGGCATMTMTLGAIAVVRLGRSEMSVAQRE